MKVGDATGTGSVSYKSGTGSRTTVSASGKHQKVLGRVNASYIDITGYTTYITDVLDYYYILTDTSILELFYLSFVLQYGCRESLYWGRYYCVVIYKKIIHLCRGNLHWARGPPSEELCVYDYVYMIVCI